MTNEEYQAAKDQLRPRLTDEFLATLVEASKITMFDSFEIDGFIHELFQIAGKERPRS